MNDRLINVLLIAVCAGSLTASGVLALQVRQLSVQLQRLDALAVAAPQNDSTQSAAHPFRQSSLVATELREEIAALREAIESLDAGRRVAENPEPDADPVQRRLLEQQQANAARLVSDAVATGYWTQNDARAFREQTRALPPATIQEIAEPVIRGLRDGTLQMPEDLLAPF